MQVISNAAIQTYQIPFFHSSITNFCGKMVSLIEQVNLKVTSEVQAKLSDNSRRIVILAISIFSLTALAYWAFKNCSISDARVPSPTPSPLSSPIPLRVSPKLKPTPSPVLTLASELEIAKRDTIRNLRFDDSKFADAESAKLFLSIEHGGKVYLETVILPKNINNKHILNYFDVLFNNIQDTIIFDSSSKIRINLGILAKSKILDAEGKPLFSDFIHMHTSVHNGEIIHAESKFAYADDKFSTCKSMQDYICEELEIPFTLQLDDHGNFI